MYCKDMNLGKILRTSLFLIVSEVIGGIIGVLAYFMLVGILVSRHVITQERFADIALHEGWLLRVASPTMALVGMFGMIVFAARHQRLKYIFERREAVIIALLSVVILEVLSAMFYASGPVHYFGWQAWLFRCATLAILYFSLKPRPTTQP